ncbi:MAG: ribosome biogenesis GTPase Der [Patescibacteria group bacterium]
MKNIDEQYIPRVVIFGRANTGKSTLFNRLTEQKSAMTSDVEGVTRDSNIGEMSWRGVDFELVDTGGITEITEEMAAGKKKAKDSIDSKVQQQSLRYLKKSDIILFVVDTKTGLLPQDKQMADFLNKNFGSDKEKRIIVVANKVDKGKEDEPQTAVFYQLGLGAPLPVSAASGSGTGDLLDEITDTLKQKPVQKEEKEQEQEKDSVSACIIGKPNAGKSSLLNSLLDYERVIVSEIPHTTREPQDAEVKYKDHLITFIDTAGINKKIRKAEGLEKYGIERSLDALAKGDIALLILDITQNITQQELKLIDEIFKKKKSLIIIANKWDLIPEKDTAKFTEYIYNKMPFATWAPIQFISASTGKHVAKIYDMILEVKKQRQTELSKSQLERFLNKIVKKHPPTKAKGYKRPYIYEITQVKTDPPKFDVRISKKDTLNESYVRFIENQLRETFGFKGTPINIEVIR